MFKPKALIFAAVALYIPFIFYIMFRSCNDSAKINSRPVGEWKQALKPIAFKGAVSNVSKFDFALRGVYSVELKNTTIQNEKSIPAGCDFFEYNDGILRFAAYSETVKRWPDYGLEDGYAVEKKANNDTLFVYDSGNSPKYIFELFDGLDSDWVPRQWPK